jgi:hypothetical protein
MNTVEVSLEEVKKHLVTTIVIEEIFLPKAYGDKPI